jgi:hypothetical protein
MADVCETCWGYVQQLPYPSGVRLWIDGTDITETVFGVEQLNPDEFESEWYDIDLSAYIDTPGRHVLEITSETPGKIDARLEIK